jgi:hypothetical protein
VNLCTACGQDFGSVELFDRHRVGKHAYTFAEGLDRGLEDGRRCLDATEMQASGWRLNARNRWTDPARDPRGRLCGTPEPREAVYGEWGTWEKERSYPSKDRHASDRRLEEDELRGQGLLEERAPEAEARMNLPLISKALTAPELRDRVLAQMNGESVRLSTDDQERRERVLRRLRRRSDT